MPDSLDQLTWVPVPLNFLGILLLLIANIPFRLGARSPWIRLGAVGLAWIGLAIVSPWLLLLAIPPAIIVVNRRRRLLRSQRLIEAKRTKPSPDLAEHVAAFTAYGYRYVATLTVTAEDGTYPIAIHRLPDLAGWIELTPTSMEIQHRFGKRSFSTADFRSTGRTPHHLVQICATATSEPRMTAHRRVLARLAHMGHRPDRLTDDDVIALLLEQIAGSYRRMATARWRDAVAHAYWEELAYQDRIGCRALADNQRFDRILRNWLGAADPD